MITDVIKIGGSVLVSLDAYRQYAGVLRDRLQRETGVRLVVIVSAQQGETDALLALARQVVDSPNAAALDLLWSTGEIRSAAVLALALQREGVQAVALDVHQSGLSFTQRLRVSAGPVRQALVDHDVVIVPGFLACGDNGRVVSLGRGGSDLSAVALAAALAARRCELLKDVPGYFTADPNKFDDARHLPQIGVDDAIAYARHGCDLVQQEALEMARHAGLTVVIAAVHDSRQTTVTPRASGADDALAGHEDEQFRAAVQPRSLCRSTADRVGAGGQHAFRDTDHSRRPAVGA